MLKAQSVAFIPESAAGAQVLRVFERLGIADAMKAKTKVQTATGNIAKAVANGEAELGVFLANTLIAPGVELTGSFPDGVQQESRFTAGAAARQGSRRRQAFLDYLKLRRCSGDQGQRYEPGLASVGAPTLATLRAPKEPLPVQHRLAASSTDQPRSDSLRNRRARRRLGLQIAGVFLEPYPTHAAALKAAPAAGGGAESTRPAAVVDSNEKENGETEADRGDDQPAASVANSKADDLEAQTRNDTRIRRRILDVPPLRSPTPAA